MSNVILSLAVALLFTLAIGAYRYWHDAINPITCFAGYWALALLVPLVLVPSFGFWPFASLYILLAAVAFFNGAVIGIGRTVASGEQPQPPLPFNLVWGKPIILLCTLIGLGGVSLILSKAGLSLIRLGTDIDQAFEIAGRHSASVRYAQRDTYGMAYSLVLSGLYIGNYTGGLGVVLYKQRDRLLALLPLLMSVLLGGVVNARMLIIWQFAMCLSGVLTGCVLTRRAIRIDLKRLLIGLAMLSCFMFFFYYLQTIRYNEPLTDAPEALAISRVSMTASPVAFSYWLERNWDHTTPTLGANTFNSLARIIRGDRMKVALDSLGWDGFDVLLEGKLFSPNVYTGFRQIIEDTTVPGSLLILFLCGVGVGIAYRKVHQGHGVWVPVLALFYFLVAGSYISLPVCFNSVLFAWGIIISATVGIRLRQRGRQRPPQTVPYAIATPLPTTKPVNV